MSSNTRTQRQISAGSAVRTTGLSAPKAPACTAAPTITGTPAVGQTLTAGAATWANTPTTILRQWIRDNELIPGATGTTYVPTSADSGHSISVRERAVNAVGYTTARSALVQIP
jgi:hypothetical protein